MGPYAMSSGAFTIDSVGPKYAGSATGLIDFAGYIVAAPFSSIVLIWIAKGYSLNAVYMFLGFIALLSTFSFSDSGNFIFKDKLCINHFRIQQQIQRYS